MIINHSLLLEIARERQQELLQQAENERCYKQLKRNHPNRLQQIGQYLVDAIEQSKDHPQSKPATPIFGGRKLII